MSFQWQYSTPQSEGLNSALLDSLDDYLRFKRYRLVNSVLVVRNGCIVYEKYFNKFTEESKNPMKSIWKSILAILTGISLEKGLIRSLDEPIANYLPEFRQDLHPYHQLISIRHLLTMSSGIYWNGGVHYHCPMVAQMMRTQDWIAHIADVAVSNYPGTRYLYKEWDVLLLSAIIGKTYGKPSYEMCEEYLYTPLGISSGRWAESPCGVSYTVMKGEEQSDLTARDLAKLGLLVLNNGLVREERIVSESYLKEMVTPNKINESYGYLWWLFKDGYGCRGFGGQEINILPHSNMVTVIQATPTTSNKAYGDIQEEILKKSIIGCEE
jgi:CubicO group peptidase (beta-lactamase class C family)